MKEFNKEDFQNIEDKFFYVKNLNKINWDEVSFCKLTEEFIREFSNEINWNIISFSQKLSEEFMREFSDKINWILASKYQEMSETFIREFQDKVCWFMIMRNQKLSEEFFKEFKYKQYPEKSNWISVDERLPEIPKGRYGIQVLVAIYDPCYAECSGKSGYSINESMYGNITKMETFDVSLGENQFMNLCINGSSEGKNFCWMPYFDRITHWMYMPDPPIYKG